MLRATDAVAAWNTCFRVPHIISRKGGIESLEKAENSSRHVRSGNINSVVNYLQLYSTITRNYRELCFKQSTNSNNNVKHCNVSFRTVERKECFESLDEAENGGMLV